MKLIDEIYQTQVEKVLDWNKTIEGVKDSIRKRVAGGNEYILVNCKTFYLRNRLIKWGNCEGLSISIVGGIYVILCWGEEPTLIGNPDITLQEDGTVVPRI